MLRGFFDKAKEEFEITKMAYRPTYKFQHGLSVLSIYEGQCYLRQNQPLKALECAEQAQRLSDMASLVRERVAADWLASISLIEIFVQTAKKKKMGLQIENYLADAIKKCHEINLIELESEILLTRARWRYVQGLVQESQKNAEEALDIAVRYNYRLKQSDIHNFLALVALKTKSRPEAFSHAKIAKDLAYCDGGEYTYKVAYDEAEKLLASLNV
jgi:hypothetical protein